MTNPIFWSPCTFHALATAETFLHCALLPYFCALLAVHHVHFCSGVCCALLLCSGVCNFCALLQRARGVCSALLLCSGVCTFLCNSAAGCAVHFFALLPYLCALFAVHCVHFCSGMCTSAWGCAIVLCTSAAGCAVHFCCTSDNSWRCSLARLGAVTSADIIESSQTFL